MAVTWGLGVHDGFGFSAGVIDYVINWHLATKPWAIVPIGLCFAVRVLRDLPVRDHEVLHLEDSGQGAGGGARGHDQAVGGSFTGRGVGASFGARLRVPGTGSSSYDPGQQILAGSLSHLHRATTGLHH